MLDDVKMQHFDYFSLDVEGGELAVLQAINFSTFSFDVIVVEADGHDAKREQAVIRLLRSNGYRYLAHVKRNDWFLNAGFVPMRNPALPPSPPSPLEHIRRRRSERFISRAHQEEEEQEVHLTSTSGRGGARVSSHEHIKI